MSDRMSGPVAGAIGWMRAMRAAVGLTPSTAAYCDPCRESEHCGACPCCALDAPFARLGEP